MLKLVQPGYLTLALCVTYTVIMAWLVPGFGTSSNASNILTAFAPLFIVALGQTLVLMSAGIDLSVTSVIAATGVCGGWLVSQDGGLLAGNAWAVPVAMLLMVGMGSLIGSINGYCIAVLRMPAFIVTLTMMMFLSGVALWGTQSQAIAGLPASLLMFGQTTWLTALVAVCLAVCLHIVLQHSLFGLHLRSVGFNADTARVSGVPVSRTIVCAYVISGGCAALASILIAGQLESCSPVQWENNLLDIVGATVIGGTSLYGGRGSVSWTAGGALLLVLIDNSLNLMSLSYFAIMITKGGVILLAALLDTARNRLSPTGAV